MSKPSRQDKVDREDLQTLLRALTAVQEKLDPVSPLELAERFYRARRRRAVIFGASDLFGEPAFDILLDLFIAASKSVEVSISDACVAADVSPTTALRYINALEQSGLIERRADQVDRRRSLLKLSERGRSAMEVFLRL